MNDGRNLKFSGDFINHDFTIDKYGALIPIPDALQLERVKDLFDQQMSAHTGLDERLNRVLWRADVITANRPLGSTPVIGFGYQMMGPSTMPKIRFTGSLSEGPGLTRAVEHKIAKRYLKELQYNIDIIALHASDKPETTDLATDLLWRLEEKQLYTGGGYDGNQIADATKSFLNFINRASEPFDFADTVLSKYVVEAALKLRESFESIGIKAGSLEPWGAHQVRFEQTTDGMLSFPVYAKSNAPWTLDMAVRLLSYTGVDTRQYVNTVVTDSNTHRTFKFRVVDAIAYLFDSNFVVTPENLLSIVTMLVRIQRHGYHVENGKVIAKGGKTRSIYPNSIIEAFVEAMIFAPFLKEIKDRQLPWMPSLQPAPIQTEMVFKFKSESWAKGRDVLSADWSSYDSTVKGGILATLIYYAIRPLYNAKYYPWVDAAIHILTFKYLVVPDDLAEKNNDLFSTAKQTGKFVLTKHGFTIFGLYNGLISGAKFTHGGGSTYGEGVIHYCIPKLLGFEPIWGPQGGDDTAISVPKEFINLNDQEATYKVLAEVAKTCGLDLNPSPAKQIFESAEGELAAVFLQRYYHVGLDIRGVGSTYRYSAALPFAEQEKGLTIAEQEMAEISKMNNGFDNPFIKTTVKDWLTRDSYLGVLFKEYGTNAFTILKESVQRAPEEIAQRIGLGDFEWGVSQEDFINGNIPVLTTMAEVAAEMSFSNDASEAVSRLRLQPGIDSLSKDEPTDDEAEAS